MRPVPKREDYADVVAWGRDYEAWCQAEDSSKVEILRDRVLALLVCAPSAMSPTEVETEVNRISPTGIGSDWRVEGKPAACEQDTRRRHWILTC